MQTKQTTFKSVLLEIVQPSPEVCVSKSLCRLLLKPSRKLKCYVSTDARTRHCCKADSESNPFFEHPQYEATFPPHWLWKLKALKQNLNIGLFLRNSYLQKLPTINLVYTNYIFANLRKLHSLLKTPKFCTGNTRQMLHYHRMILREQYTVSQHTDHACNFSTRLYISTYCVRPLLSHTKQCSAIPYISHL